MDKNDVLKATLTAFESKVKELERQLEDVRDRARDAPGSNVTHSDTSKFQLSNLALGIDTQLQESRQALTAIRLMPSTKCTQIRLGALFTLKDAEKGVQKTYLLVTKGGGETIVTMHTKIITLSAGTPIARACLGKEEGDEVKVGDTTLEVVEIL